MSASTVSITANPAATRRRPLVVGEKRPPVDLVGGDGVAASPAAAGGGGAGAGDKGIGKDLSHSIRGETVLERSARDVIQVKKPLPPNSTAIATATAVPRRTSRKGVSKPEKSRWRATVSILTKNALLLLVILGLFQMIRRLVLIPGSVPAVPSSSASLSEVIDFEGRIAEMEAFLKTATKMMQVQVEVVDRKIVNEIGGLRRDMGKKIEDKVVEFANDLKKLDSRTESLEKSLGELRASDWLSKDDFDKFFNEFKKAKGLDGSDVDVSLDEVRALALEILEKEIEKHAADGLGRVDYALASGGGMVVKHSEPYIVGKGGSWSWFYTPNRNGVHTDAEKMLRPSFGEPGQCFPLKGSNGFVQIKLRTAVVPEAITLEHVAKNVAYDRSSAPKNCRVSGWLQGLDPTDLVVNSEMLLLTEFTYDLEKSNAQTFNVLDSAGSGVVDTIRLDFTSNHGSPSHTCIYRLRVHGHEPSSVSMLETQS